MKSERPKPHPGSDAGIKSREPRESPLQLSRDVLLTPEKTVDWCFGILDSIYDGILVADESAVVRYVNPEYTRITGVAREQIVGRPLLEVRPGAILPRVIGTGIPLAGVFRREGDIEYVVDMAPIMIDGKIMGGVSVLKDITEVQRLSNELKKTMSQTDRLKSIVHHAYRAKYSFDDVLGNSDSLLRAVRLAKRISASDNGILITGESGTGKEIFAQAVHDSSMRSAGPFVPVSCAVLTPTLIESELFGFGEGAFTGAKKGGKIGLFEIADGGTIFLDEIAELPMDMQAKILRTLQERTIRRIGETWEQPVDVRVTAATHRDLAAMVREGRFREDLYYRLNVINLHLPPLRDRDGDIPLLADHFLGRCCLKMKRHLDLSPDVQVRFSHYRWPGNIRELIHTVEFAANMAESAVIQVQDLPRALQADPGPKSIRPGTLSDIMRDVERKILENRLRYYGTGLASKRRLARDLDISLATLYNKLRVLGVKTDDK